jgi:hypothetical protein
VEDEPPASEGAQEPSVRQADPLDLVETVREGSFCDTFAVAPEDTLGHKLYEVVTNAVQYAFPSETRGSVVVTLKRIPGEFRLAVSDEGSILDARIPGSVADWSGSLRDSLAARSSGRATAREHCVSDIAVA